MTKNRLLKNRIVYAILLSLSIIYFLFANDGISLGIFLILVILPLLSLLITIIFKQKLSIVFYLSDNKLEINANRIIPIHVSFAIENMIFSVKKPGEHIIFSKKSEIKFSNLLIGKNQINVNKIVVLDYFSLFAFPMKTNYSCFIEILPSIKNVNFKSIYSEKENSESEIYKQSNIYKESPFYSSYKEYVPGDSLKSVNWKISSKLDRLFVKVEEEKINNSFTLIFNSELNENDQELMELFFSLSYRLIEKGYGHNIVICDKKNKQISNYLIDSISSFEIFIHKAMEISFTTFDLQSYILNNNIDNQIFVIGECLINRNNIVSLTKEDLYE